jgi:hypothetical protein
MTNGNLTFTIAVPAGWQELDLLDPTAAEALGAPLTDALAFAAHGTDQAQLLMLRSLVAVTESREPLAAGLTAQLAAPSAPISRAPLDADAFGDAEVSAIKLPAGSGLRVRRVVPTMVGDLPVAALQVQYLLETEHGLLAITLDTPQAAETEDWEALFDALAATARLGDAPRTS